MGREGKRRKGRGRHGRGGKGSTGREGTPIFCCTPSSSFLEICLFEGSLANADARSVCSR